MDWHELVCLSSAIEWRRARAKDFWVCLSRTCSIALMIIAFLSDVIPMTSRVLRWSNGCLKRDHACSYWFTRSGQHRDHVVNDPYQEAKHYSRVGLGKARSVCHSGNDASEKGASRELVDSSDKRLGLEKKITFSVYVRILRWFSTYAYSDSYKYASSSLRRADHAQEWPGIQPLNRWLNRSYTLYCGQDMLVAHAFAF